MIGLGAAKASVLMIGQHHARRLVLRGVAINAISGMAGARIGSWKACGGLPPA
jgi:hypothetical protein